jgi:hypothetical protein
MPIAGNPKKLAQDVAQGYQQFTQATLRQYSPEDLKIILFNLNFVLREIRGKQVALEDIEALKEKNTQLRRLNQAVSIVQVYCSSRKIKL